MCCLKLAPGMGHAVQEHTSILKLCKQPELLGHLNSRPNKQSLVRVNMVTSVFKGLKILKEKELIALFDMNSGISNVYVKRDFWTIEVRQKIREE